LKTEKDKQVLKVKIYIIKELVQPKMSHREFLIWKERGRGCERERGVGG
jgi:hypothetical protein